MSRDNFDTLCLFYSVKFGLTFKVAGHRVDFGVKFGLTMSLAATGEVVSNLVLR